MLFLWLKLLIFYWKIKRILLILEVIKYLNIFQNVLIAEILSLTTYVIKTMFKT
jgi:hypothetical protein